jgi:hypothetical protein
MAPEAAPAGGGPPAAAPAPPGAPPPAAAPQAAAAPPSSALASVPAAGAAAPTGLEFLAEKFHVKGADGKLDEAASLRKQAEAYAPLVKRLGTDELPPATPAEYKIAAPKELDQAAFDGFLKDPATVTALEGMHKLGLTNTQASAVMSMYLESAQMLAAGGPALSAEDTITELRKEWKTETDLTKNMGAARHAATTLGAKVGLDFAAIEAAGLANNPAFIRMMAAMAPELGEDRAPTGAALPATDLDSLVKSKAYMDPTDPNHAAVKAKVTAHFASLPGGANKPKGPVSIQL